MAGINAERDMWKHLTEVMDRLNKVEQEAKKQHKCKNRQKMAGGFRTAHGLDIFCSLLSITETCKRQTINLLLAFRSLFARLPLFS